MAEPWPPYPQQHPQQYLRQHPPPYAQEYPRQYAQHYGRPPAPGYSSPPPWGYPWAPPPPRRRRSSGSTVTLALVGISAVVLFVLVLANAVIGSLGGSGFSEYSVEVDHSPARASNPNADPVETADARAVLESNTLYEQGGLANGYCPAQDLGNASGQHQTSFYEALMDCMNDEWRPVVESAGYVYTSPDLVAFDSAIQTPCGTASPQDGRTLAFYCPTDEVMYADVPQMRRFFADNDVAYAIVIAHEFGHHVQNEVGTLKAARDVSYAGLEDQLDTHRRVELQASCMGGLFLGAVAESYPMDETRLQQLDQVAGSFGDEPGADDADRDHGSGASNRTWIANGYTENDVSACNTFVVPDDEVD